MSALIIWTVVAIGIAALFTAVWALLRAAQRLGDLFDSGGPLGPEDVYELEMLTETDPHAEPRRRARSWIGIDQHVAPRRALVARYQLGYPVRAGVFVDRGVRPAGLADEGLERLLQEFAPVHRA